MCGNDIWLQLVRPGWQDAPPLALDVSLGLVGTTTVLVPLLAVLCKWDRSRLILASRLWFCSSACATTGAIAGLGVPHIVDQANRYSVLARPTYTGYRTVIVLWPGVCAVISFILAVLGVDRILGALDMLGHACGWQGHRCSAVHKRYCDRRWTFKRKSVKTTATAATDEEEEAEAASDLSSASESDLDAGSCSSSSGRSEP